MTDIAKTAFSTGNDTEASVVSKKELELLTTAGCHLCDQAVAVMAQVIDLESEQSEVVVYALDIAESEALVERYGLLIPVVRDCHSAKELRWPFDADAFLQFLDE
ncbi:MAG: glutaredoxin family protein [Pontibacterium sp.]